MISVSDIISIQNTTDVSAFIRYQENRNKRKDVRNVALYRAYLKGEEGLIAQEIGANAFNALKKRLIDQLIEFTAGKLLSNELSSENSVIKLIVISRRLFAEDHIHTAYTLLKRAEKIALSLDQYSLLNEIFHTAIEHSHKVETINQEELFKKLELNNEKFIAEERLGVLYASLRKQYNSKDFNILPNSLHDLYNKGLSSFDINPELAMNFRSLNQLCVLTDLYGSQTKNYHNLDLFFEPMIEKLLGTDKDTEKMLACLIESLYTLSNIYFRRKEAKKSLYYLKLMKVQMARYGGRHGEVWKSRYVNLYALNLNFTGHFKEAIDSVESYLQENKVNEIETSLLKLTLCMMAFQQSDLKKVKTIISSFNKANAWYLNKLGNEWLFNLRAMEVLLHFDLGNDQLAESKILSFQRKYARHFKKDTGNPLWPFLILVKSVLFHSDKIHTEEFARKVENSIHGKGDDEDFFNMCFYSWLKAKMIKQPVYKTTLELLNFN